MRKHISALVRALDGQAVKMPTLRSRLLAAAAQEALDVVSEAAALQSWAPLNTFVESSNHELSRIFVASLRGLLVERGNLDFRVVDSSCVLVSHAGPLQVYWTSIVYPEIRKVVLPTVVKGTNVVLEARTVLGLRESSGELPGMPKVIEEWESWNLFTAESLAVSGSGLQPVAYSDLQAACGSVLAARLSQQAGLDDTRYQADLV